MEKVLFSIVIPVYNAEKYLEESVNSILKQSFKDFELILVNDGSTDSSLDICEKLKERDKRIKVIHQENQKATKARINGMKIAKGDYIYSVDADDYVDENLLMKVNEILKLNNPDMLMFRYNKVLENKKIFNEISKYPYEGFMTKKEFYNNIFDDFRLNSLVIKVIKKSKLNFNELEKLKGINSGEDLLLTLYFLENIENIYLINDILYSYRENSQSITRKFQIDRIDDIIYLDKIFLEKIKKFNEKNLNKKLYLSHLKSILEYVYSLSAEKNIELKRKKVIFSRIKQEELYCIAKEYYKKDLNIKLKIVYLLFEKEYDIILIILSKIYKKTIVLPLVQLKKIIKIIISR